MSDASGPTQGQEKIWSHFQNVAPTVFEDSHPRQDFLVKRIRNGAVRSSGGQGVAVLNIGAGDGYLERRLLGLGCRVSSLDPDEGVVRRLQGDGVDAHAGSIDEMPFADASFDFVVATEVLEHLSESERQGGVREITRVLEPGGWFLGTVPFRERLEQGATVCPDCGHVFHRWGHRASFDQAALDRMMPAGLRLVESRPTAFSPLLGRGPRGFVKALGRRVLARLGEPVSQPTLFFAAQRA
jgi:SAM-dependent methyltransferase